MLGRYSPLGWVTVVDDVHYTLEVGHPCRRADDLYPGQAFQECFYCQVELDGIPRR